MRRKNAGADSRRSTERPTGGGERRPPARHRRGPTKWLLITPLATLGVVIVGVMALEAAAPVAEPADRRVDGVPPLALEEERDCVRRLDDPGAEDVREEFEEGGRVSSTQVSLCPSAFDGLDVTYVGEVVGELLPRRGGMWAQVNDDAYALELGPLVDHRERAGFNTGMAVWLPDGLHEEVEQAGRPGRRGDVILVQGTLVRADPDDGGGTTVRAEHLELLAESEEIDEPFHLPQAIVAALLAVAAVGSVIWARVVRKR